jgi:GT2 family glycosyltransferase/glycosyltransferase involved in cell wall biosynthesis
MAEAQTPLLPSELAPLQRGAFLGELEGFLGSGGIGGWACHWGQGGSRGPIQVTLTLEDLLNPSSCWKLAEVLAHRPRPDLPGDVLERNCGFLFLGHSGVGLPPHGRGLVLRAFFDAERRVELPGSPLRLDAERYARLKDLCLLGLGRRARLGGVTSHQIRGWASGSTPLQVRIDDTVRLPVVAPDPLPMGEWPFQLDLPRELCDGALHHLLLETEEEEAIDERLELLPFLLTPWAALLQHGQAPFPDQLSPLARERQRSLLTWIHQADRTGQPLPAQLPLWQRLLSQPLRRDGEGTALPPGCEPGPQGAPVPRQPLELPVSEQPRVSIVIPMHGQYPSTRRCLAAIAYAPTSVPYELIVVDDGSKDDSARWLAEEAPAVRVVRHDFARGFNQACCSGAAVARGEVIVLLNNDTEPCAHWLEELLAPFAQWSDTGLVGAQLVMANGRLQEAGGIVWGNGEPWNYGRGCNPYDPRYAYARQVDYASGAALAIRAELWRQVGGFSPEFSPAYYEDTDLAFKVREAGLQVRYAPLARVIHHEGVSNGSDTEAAEGLKRYQTINAPLFEKKWAAAFEGPSEPNLSDAERIKDRGIVGRALFIDHDTPRPDRDAGSHAALVEMELVQALGWKISFLPANLAWLGSYTEALQRRGIEALHAPFVLSLEQLLRERGDEFDLIYITRYSVASGALPLISRHAPQARVLFCNADLHHLRELRAARAQGLEGEAAERALEQVRDVQRQELEVIRQVHLTFSYSDVEQAVIEAETLGAAPTATCPWVVEGPSEPVPLEGRSGLAFLGSFGHPPNHEAMVWFLAEVWPELHQRCRWLRVHLYGSGMPAELGESWGAIPGVVLEGWVADPATVYSRHRLFIAPLRSGAGLKGKVAAAAAHGMPQVLSPVAAEATGLRHGEEIWIARGSHDWIHALERLSQDDDSWRAMSAAAHRYARHTWSRERGLALMEQALQRLNLPVRVPE